MNRLIIWSVVALFTTAEVFAENSSLAVEYDNLNTSTIFNNSQEYVESVSADEIKVYVKASDSNIWRAGGKVVSDLEIERVGNGIYWAYFRGARSNGVWRVMLSDRYGYEYFKEEKLSYETRRYYFNASRF